MNQDEGLITKLQNPDKKVLVASEEPSDVQMKEEKSAKGSIDEKVEVSFLKQCELKETSRNPNAVTSSPEAPGARGEEPCAPKETSGLSPEVGKAPAELHESKQLVAKKKLRSQKKVDDSVRKEITKRKIVKPIRKRTKLKSSGESSSSEPMDLSKRRDVVNKTILRVVRRYFTSKFKATIDMKYGNPSDTQDRYANHQYSPFSSYN